MVDPLTPEELADLRADIGDTSSSPAFTDDELQRLHERAEGDPLYTRVLCLRQLLANAAKLFNYTSGFTRVDQAVIFDRILKLLEYYESLAAAGEQVRFVGIAFRPPYFYNGPGDITDAE